LRLRADDPHREELRPAAVGVAQGAAGAVDLVLAGLAHHLEGGLGEADHATGADRVRREHAAAHVDGQLAVERGRSGLGELPAAALLSEAEILHPHRLEPRERHVDLGAVDLAERVGDAGALPEVRRRLAAGQGIGLVALGVRQRLRAHHLAVDPGGVLDAGGGDRVGGGDHHRAGAVGGGAGLVVPDRVPQDL